MPRITYQPPVKARASCHEGLTDLASCTAFVEEYVLPSYTIGLHECCSGKMDSRGFSSLAGWRFVVAESDGHVLMADLTASPCGTDGEVVSITDSQYARKVMEGIRSMEELFRERLGRPSPDYQLRWLSIPSILVEGLWLHAAECTNTSWVRPLLALCPEMREIPLFTFDDLLAHASRLGKKREAVDDTPIYY